MIKINCELCSNRGRIGYQENWWVRNHVNHKEYKEKHDNIDDCPTWYDGCNCREVPCPECNPNGSILDLECILCKNISAYKYYRETKLFDIDIIVHIDCLNFLKSIIK